ncbi:hypothetical protein OSB04_031653 [Centaurea solstitialis]|uniref:Uncharacterized protein n=1 Tax=Centaurea solstitialis TaxID=347529 RepID=A0AA38S9Y2_9ASTR|nr:hypothetical protein OSB04_031653 [Centaurea solstitialis]
MELVSPATWTAEGRWERMAATEDEGLGDGDGRRAGGEGGVVHVLVVGMVAASGGKVGLGWRRREVCGPPGMMEHVSGGKAKDWSQGEVCIMCLVSGVLKELGYTEEMVYKF